MAIIACDFDGTCVTHEFPKIGKDIGAVPVLKELIANGHKLILWTMRSDIVNPKSESECIILESGYYLSEAVRWFKENEIPLFGVQTNPTQSGWTKSPKAYAELYIDDAGLGCPLIYVENGRPYVDWQSVREILIGIGLIGC
ncbi:MAG: hypothetical protein WC479_07110 [Candidatus Izemoplasmatales bacterium]